MQLGLGGLLTQKLKEMPIHQLKIMCV